MKRLVYITLLSLSSSLIISKAPATSSRIIDFHVTRSSSSLDAFQQRISEGCVIVDFYAPWCGPCKRIAPIFNELASKYTNVTFIKVNIDDHKEIAQKYNIRSIPQLLFFKNGALCETFVGQKSKNDITRALDKHFK